MSILNVNKINPVGGGSTITIAGITSVTSSISIASSCTATSYYGNGANLTGIDLGAVTGATGDFSIADKIVHTGDTNTAIRFPAADTITAETGGSERVRINSDGDLLVGRTSTIDASEVLGIKGPDSEHCTFGVTSDGTTQAGIIAFNDDDATFRGRIQYNHNGDSMVFNTAASERVRITSTGLVGLGNASPQGELHIGVADNSNHEAMIVLNNGGATGNDAGIEWRYESGTTPRARIYVNSSDQIIRFDTANSERLRLGSTGNFALGNTYTSGYSGQTNFFIGGTANIYADTSSGSGKSFSITNNSYINSSGNWVYRATDKASNIYQYNGTIGFRTVASGTAGNTISWSERLRIANDGTITNTGSNSAPTSGSGFGFTQDQLYLSTDGTGANYALRFYNDNGLVGSALVNGSSTTYNTSSDYRLKENVVTISDGITRLKQLKPYRFNFKADTSTTLDGFFAHEAQSVVPEAVTGTKDQVANADDVTDGLASAVGDAVYQGIDHSKFVPLLTAALQEAVAKIETLESEVAALKGS